MERFKPARLTRRKFTTLALSTAAKVLIASACSRLPLSSDQDIKPQVATTPLMPAVVLSPDSYEFCKPVTIESRKVNQAAAGMDVSRTEVRPDPPLDGPPDEIDFLQISESSIISNKRFLNQKTMNVGVIAVGYPGDLGRIAEFTNTLETMFSDVPSVQFSYFNKSVSLGINQVDELTEFTKNSTYLADKLIARLNQVYKFHQTIFVVNTNKHIGSSHGSSKIILVSGEGNSSRAASGHEMGHALDLYDAFFDENYEKNISNEGFLTDVNSLRPRAKLAILKHRPPLVHVGKCTREGYPHPVYKPYGLGHGINLMERIPLDEEFMEALRQGRKVFNPVQFEIMEMYAQLRVDFG